jgi:branched-chain amino acid transport system permease protein
VLVSPVPFFVSGGILLLETILNTINQLPQHLLNGLSLGGIYALIALGYTMVYGILKFINFAHGEIMMMGTYSGLLMYNLLRGSAGYGPRRFFSFILAFIIAMMSSALLGIVVEKLAYRPLRKAPRLAPLLSAIGVSIVLMNLGSLLFSSKSKPFLIPFQNDPIRFAGLSITPLQILIISISVAMMILLTLFIEKTRYGKAMRATSQNPRVAMLMGINSDFVISMTFAIGSALGAAAGILYAMEYDASPFMGMQAGLKAFIAAVVGGIGNIGGAMLGGFILGLLETVGVVIINIILHLFSLGNIPIDSVKVAAKDIISFTLLLVILLFKPAGLLGKARREKV